ncbi:hypothetical protein MQA17_20200, partial [Escherichia coli]|nr:hypothetical protein [Escherichia coli]
NGSVKVTRTDLHRCYSPISFTVIRNLYPGPESEPIRAAAVKKLEAYITAQHRLGRDIRLSAIYAALHVEGVQRVELAAPLADIVLNNTQASFCTEYRVVTGGLDE